MDGYAKVSVYLFKSHGLTVLYKMAQSKAIDFGRIVAHKRITIIIQKVFVTKVEYLNGI